MTKEEMSKLLDVHEVKIRNAFAEAKKLNPKLDVKGKAFNKNRAVDWTLEEALEVLQHIPYWNPMMSRYLKENFIHRDSNFVYNNIKPIPKDVHDFIFLYIKSPKYTCVCVSCAYFNFKQMNKVGSKQKPFCSFYNVFLNKVLPKRNIYKDKCDTFVHTNRVPFVETPTGIKLVSKVYEATTDLFGIEQSEFISKRAPDEPLILLHDAFNFKD